MLVRCPSCRAETTLDVLIGREHDALAVVEFLQRHLPLGDLLVRYVALHRPPKRGLSISRALELMDEVVGHINRGSIPRRGRDWPCDHDTWRAGLEQVLLARDKGTLTLPLSGHGFLLEVLAGLADKAEARAEKERERARREHRPAGPVLPPQPLASLAQAAGTAAGTPPAAAPADEPYRPSRAAREFKARLALQQQRQAAAAEAPAGEAPPPASDPGSPTA
jgi:hypothetical protein